MLFFAKYVIRLENIVIHPSKDIFLIKFSDMVTTAANSIVFFIFNLRHDMKKWQFFPLVDRIRKDQLF